MRNDETGTPLAAKKGRQQRQNRKTGKREVQNKSELNCGTVATLVEPENFVLQLSPGLTLEISRQSGIVQRSLEIRNCLFVVWDHKDQLGVRSELPSSCAIGFGDKESEKV